MPDTPDVVLDEKLCAFVRGGVSILAASRNADNRPCVTRVAGCSVLGDNRLLISVPLSRSQHLIDAVRTTGHIAVVFSEPSTHKTIQVKGTDAEVVTSGHNDVSQLANYRAAFAKQLTDIGYSDALAHALVGVDAADLTGIAFTATALFDQTPGPRAGEPVVQTR